MKRTLQTTAWLSLLVTSLLTSSCFFDGSALEDRGCDINQDCIDKINDGTLAAPGRGFNLFCGDAVCQTAEVTCNDSGRSIFNPDGTLLTPNACARQIAAGDYGLVPPPEGQEYVCSDENTCELVDLPAVEPCQVPGSRINLAFRRANPLAEGGTEEMTPTGVETLCSSGTVAFFLPGGEDSARCDAVCCADKDNDGTPDLGTNDADCAVVFEERTDCDSNSANARPGGPSLRVNGATAGMDLPVLPDNCDGLDNDCDGTADGPVLADQDTTGRCAMQDGACAGALKACINGRYRDCTEQDYRAQNDAFLLKEQYCANGINPATGDCMGGVVEVERCAEGYNPTTGGCLNNAINEVAVTPELLCDSVDNDCDGTADPGPTRVEGVIQPGIALPCYPSDRSTSEAGSNFCQLGLNTCTAGSYAADCPTCALTQDDTGAYNLEAYDACLGEFKAVTPLNEDSPLLQCGYGSEDGERYILLDEDCDATGGASGAELACQCDADVTCYEGPAGTSGVGACLSGLFICDLDAATLDMDTCVGQNLPASETCANTGDDNDCDGSSAELLDGADLAAACRNTGNLAPCGTAGREFRCEQSGDVFCTSTAVQTGGLLADEPCTLPTLLGECARGRTACGANGITCEQAIMPQAETCDDMGVDNDCDGATDDIDVRAPLGGDPSTIPATLITNIAPSAGNNFRGDFGECTATAIGRCAEGRWACEVTPVEGTRLATCTPQDPRTETGGNVNGNLCDSVDDDCDSMVDENCPDCAGPGVCN